MYLSVIYFFKITQNFSTLAGSLSKFYILQRYILWTIPDFSSLEVWFIRKTDSIFRSSLKSICLSGELLSLKIYNVFLEGFLAVQILEYV